MTKKTKLLPRVFFDVEIGDTHAGRIVFQLFSDVCPKTTENFRSLCTGEKGNGLTTSKPLHYKGVIFHRVVRDFMVQAGDFSEGNGRGGESIYGGFFADESFERKHDQPFLLSMANRGKNTNGSQFFITTQPAPHLDGIHVVFGQVVSGESIVKKIEAQPTDANSRPITKCKIVHCGELVLAKTKKVKAKKKTSAKDSDGESAGSSQEDSSDSEAEKKKKKKNKKRKKHKKEKKKHKNKSKESSDEAANKEELPEDNARTFSTIKPEEVPPVPEQKFLLRGDVQKDEAKEQSGKTPASDRSQGREWRTRSGRKVKGRGVLRYRTPSRSRSRSPYRRSYRSRRGSETPPHWREAQRGQRPLREVSGRSRGSPGADSGRWRHKDSPSDTTAAEKNNRVLSPWASDDDKKEAIESNKILSEGEWSDTEDCALDDHTRQTNEVVDQSQEKLECLLPEKYTVTPEGPALPPGFIDKATKKRHHSRSKLSKKKKKSKRSKHTSSKFKPPKEGVEEADETPVENNLNIALVEQSEEIQLPQTQVEETESTPVVNDSAHVTKSKWDSTDEDDDMKDAMNHEMPEEVSVANAHLPEPHIVSGVVVAEHLLRDQMEGHDSIKHKHKKRQGVKKKLTRGRKMEDQKWQEADVRARQGSERKLKRKKSVDESSRISSAALRKKIKHEIAPLATSKRTNRGSSRQSSARLFEQARNVLLKAEAQLAAMGYRRSRDRFGRRLRSKSYSTSRSRSSSRGHSRRYRRHSRRRRSYSSDSRYRHRSSSRSFQSRQDSRSSSVSSSRLSRSRTTSKSGTRSKRSTSTSSHSRSRSPLRSDSSSSKSSSRSSDTHPLSKIPKQSLMPQDVPVSENVVPVVNIPKKVKVDVTGVVGTSAEKMIEEPRTLSKGKSKKFSSGMNRKGFLEDDAMSDEEDPYYEKSRKKNKMHGVTKKSVDVNLESDAGMTAASVRKAEKAKKQKKMRAERLLWQPPIEFGEEEERLELGEKPDENKMDMKRKIRKKKFLTKKAEDSLGDRSDVLSTGNDARNMSSTTKDDLEEDEIDKMLSSGIEVSTVPAKKKSGDTLEKRSVRAEMFRMKLTENHFDGGNHVKEGIQKGDDGEKADGKSFGCISNHAIQDTSSKDAISGFGIMPKYQPKGKLAKLSLVAAKPDPENSDLDSIWPEESSQSSKKDIRKLPEVKNEADKPYDLKIKRERSDAVSFSQEKATPKPLVQTQSFRVQSQKKAAVEDDSSESEEEWMPPKIQKNKKTITFNIKLANPPPEEEEPPTARDEGKKSHRKHKKKKKIKKDEESLSSLEAIARTLRRHREEEKGKEEIKSGSKLQNSKLPQGSNDVTMTASTAINNTETASNTQNANPPVNTTHFSTMRFPMPPYQMTMPPRGFTMPFHFGNMHPMSMRYNLPMALVPNMPPLPDGGDQPPLPEESFPSQPPEPKEKTCKLSDKAVSNLFNKKNITAERLSALLDEEEQDETIRVPSPAPSLKHKKSRHRSYRRRRSYSSDSSSSHSSRSSSRSRRSHRSRSYSSDRSRSYSTDSSDYSSDSEHDYRCRHYRRRSSSRRSRSRSHYSSSSRSRSRSRSRRRTRSRSSDGYSSYSDYSRRSRSSSRSSYDSRYDDSR